MMIKSSLLLLSIVVLSCNDMDNKPELVDRLRAFGVATDAVSYQPSTTNTVASVSLNFLLVSNQTVAPTWSELSVDNSVQIGLTNIALQEQTNNDDISLINISATAVLPQANQLNFANTDGSATVTYGLQVVQGADDEWIRGQIKVFPEGQAPSYDPPSITITSHSDGDTVPGGDIDLIATLDQSSEENFRIGWLVSAGSMEDTRRSLEAEWKEATAGERTVIVTARGLDSGNFTWQAIQLTVE